MRFFVLLGDRWLKCQVLSAAKFLQLQEYVYHAKNASHSLVHFVSSLGDFLLTCGLPPSLHCQKTRGAQRSRFGNTGLHLYSTPNGVALHLYPTPNGVGGKATKDRTVQCWKTNLGEIINWNLSIIVWLIKKCPFLKRCILKYMLWFMRLALKLSRKSRQSKSYKILTSIKYRWNVNGSSAQYSI